MRVAQYRGGKSTSIPATSEELPPFFGGPFRVGVIMALAQYGALRLGQIEFVLGKTIHNRATHDAVKVLDAFGIVTRKIHSKVYVVVDLDVRHPAYNEIKAFGLALFRHYLKKSPQSKAPYERYPAVRPPGRLNPKKLDMHLLGDDPPFRFLHLLAEGDWFPANVMVRWNRASRGAYGEGGSIDYLRKLGIVKTQPRGQNLFVRLDPKWFAYKELRALLLRLNQHLTEYKGMATLYRQKRDLGLMTFKYKHNQTRLFNRRVSERKSPQKTDD